MSTGDFGLTHNSGFMVLNWKQQVWEPRRGKSPVITCKTLGRDNMVINTSCTSTKKPAMMSTTYKSYVVGSTEVCFFHCWIQFSAIQFNSVIVPSQLLYCKVQTLQVVQLLKIPTTAQPLWVRTLQQWEGKHLLGGRHVQKNQTQVAIGYNRLGVRGGRQGKKHMWERVRV